MLEGNIINQFAAPLMAARQQQNALMQQQYAGQQNGLAGLFQQAAQYNAMQQYGGPQAGSGGASALDVAGKAIGLNEGSQKAALQEFLKNGGQNLDPAVTAWCAAFVDASLQQSGSKGTGKLNARSYLDWGSPVDTPQKGDIAVFSRGDPDGWKGHVGFFQGYNEDGSINVLGGNQGGGVNVSPYSANRLLGFRRG